MTPTPEEMLAHLNEQIDVMARVQASLAAERQAALEAALAEKNEWLTRAAELEQQRQLMGVDASGADELRSRWAVLMNLTAECRARNADNGALIRGQRRLVQNALDWLRGDPDAPTLYGPDGANHGARNRATLASV